MNGHFGIDRQPYDEALVQHRVELEKRAYFREYVLTHGETRRFEESAHRESRFRLGVHIASRKVRLSESREVSYPATWWDAFKVRFFPRWALSRWPAVATTLRLTVEADAVALFPEIQFPGNKGCVVFYGFENERVGQ